MKHDDAFGALVLANPIADADAYRDQMVEPNVFLTMTTERIDEMDTMHTTPETPEPTRKWKPIIVAIGAAAVVAAAVLFASALQGDDAEVVGQPTIQLETRAEPTATFDGAACVYDGPSEYDVGSTVAFTVTNESETPNVGFAVRKFPEGTTPQEIYDEGIFNVVSRTTGYLGLKSSPTTPGVAYDFTVTFSETGQHGINCFEFPGPAAEADHVTMFTVNG
jgi:hypothetical protein